MFGGLKRQWREARAKVLRGEFEDAVARLQGLALEVNTRAAATMAAAFRTVQSRYGNLENVSNDGKRQIAKEILRAAKEKFTLDLGAAYGLALTSMHIECQALPGDDARFVQLATTDILKTALEVADQVSRESVEASPPATISGEQLETIETVFCLSHETQGLLDRAGSDHAAFDQIEAVLKEALRDSKFIASSLELAATMKRAMEEEPKDAYYLARCAVESGRLLQAKSARQSAEIFLARKLSEDQWNSAELQSLRKRFDQAWRDTSSFSSPRVEWLKGEIHRQYLCYLRDQYSVGKKD